ELLARIGDAIPLGMPWRIVTEAHLGVFSFQKLVMYQDLQRHDGQVLDHPLLQALGGEGPLPEDGSGNVAGGDLDARVRPHQTFEILDADSSQQEAVIAAKSGASFVLQGPPGTGKSQTIANIIAESLALGRKVLFVSEKMAALEIVRERLAEAGLGDFLLDLHSHKTNKKDFIAELKAALIGAESGPAAADLDAVWQRESDQLHATRGELNTYARALHAPLLALRRSAFDAYGALARLADAPDLTFSLPGLEGITEADLDTMRQALEQLHTWSDVLDAYETFPWRETLASDYSLALEADIRRSFTRLGAALDRLRTAAIPLRAALAEPEAPLTFGWAELAVRRAETALRTPRPPLHWLTPEAPARLRMLADNAAELSARHARGSAALDPIYSAAAKQLDHAALRRALTSDARRSRTFSGSSREISGGNRPIAQLPGIPTCT
ncbi:MAG TPA: AAA domain-containing protein, partial [Ktedonobacterales bacterium]|nr:AAA domain-containing protein [Ktedonobacterales bacterium]